MNEFDYQIQLAHINSLKTVKELDIAIRTLCSKFRYGSVCISLSVEDRDTMKFVFKLYTRALQLFKAKYKSKFPDFIYNKTIDLSESFTQYMFIPSTYNNNTLTTYEEFFDLFQYAPAIYIESRITQTVYKNMAVIVGNRPLPAPIYNTLKSHDKYRHFSRLINPETWELFTWLEELPKGEYTVINELIQSQLNNANRNSSYDRNGPLPDLQAELKQLSDMYNALTKLQNVLINHNNRS